MLKVAKRFFLRLGRFNLAACMTCEKDEANIRCMLGAVQNRLADRSPAEALKYLFRMEDLLYEMEAMQAVAHDGGVHAKHRLTRYHDFFIERIAPAQRVLDVGCGNGALSRDIAERAAATVTGIDLSAANIAAARQRRPHPQVQYVVGDALTDLPREAFDVIVLSNVLEHIHDRGDFLRGLVRVHAPSRLLIRVPVFNRDWRVPLRREVGAEWRLDETHCTEYLPEEFIAEMDAAGLRIVSLSIQWGEIWSEVSVA